MNYRDKSSTASPSSSPPSQPRRRWCAMLLTGLLLAGYSSAVSARPGYAGLINSYCKEKSRPQVRYTDNGCANCHHEGTFTADAAHRVQPAWNEFERGRAANDFSFFCPASSTSATPAPISLVSGTSDLAPAVDKNSMAWMALGFPTGHAMTESGVAPVGDGKNAASISPDKVTSRAAVAAQGGVRAAGPAAETKRQLAALHHDLAIDRRQESVWQELQDAVLAVDGGGSTTATASSPDLTLLLQERQRRLAQRTAQLRAVNTASVRLRAQLNEKQQRLLALRLPPLLGKP